MERILWKLNSIQVTRLNDTASSHSCAISLFLIYSPTYKNSYRIWCSLYSSWYNHVQNVLHELSQVQKSLLLVCTFSPQLPMTYTLYSLLIVHPPGSGNSCFCPWKRSTTPPPPPHLKDAQLLEASGWISQYINVRLAAEWSSPLSVGWGGDHPNHWTMGSFNLTDVRFLKYKESEHRHSHRTDLLKKSMGLIKLIFAWMNKYYRITYKQPGPNH